MTALLALIPARYLAAIAALILAAGAALAGLALHDHAVRADLVASQTAAQAVADAAQHQRVVAVLGTALADQRAAAERAAQIKEAIGHAADTNDCAGSAAVRAALLGLRGHTDGATGGHPAEPADVPGGTDAAAGGQ